MTNKFKDYYETLEVHPKASPEIIKKAYTTLAKKYHPDLNAENEKISALKMIELNEAYEVISNPIKRKEYDASYFSQPNRQPNKEQHKPANNGQQSTTTNVDKDILVLHEQLVAICKQIIDECAGKIIKTESAIANNLFYCNKNLARFEKEAMPLVPKFIKKQKTNPNIFSDAMDWYAVTLYSIALNYTWANKFITAENLFCRAIYDFKPGSDIINKIVAAKKGISKSVDIQRSHASPPETPKKSNGTPSISIIPFISIGIIAFLVLFFSLSGKNSSSSLPSKPPSALPVATASTQPAKPSFVPVLDKPTGYDKNFQQKLDSGECKVTIDNTRNNFPVYVKIYKLSNGLIPARAFYIQNNDQFTANNIPPGQYDVRYRNLQTGSISKTQSFELEQHRTVDGIEYSIISFTLFTVPGGNTRMTSIDETQFP